MEKEFRNCLKKTGEGEGWVFWYGHVTPMVEAGDKVKQGELIATKTAPNEFTAHFQMSRFFNDFKFSENNLCWPEYLNYESSSELTKWWDEYRASDVLIDGWRGLDDGSEYAFRGLISDGQEAKLCYPPGTDVR